MNRENRHLSFTITLHWLMAFLIIGALGIGLYMEDMPDTAPEKFVLFQLHKSMGLSVLMLLVARLLWRLIQHKSFKLLVLDPLERVGAKIVYVLFYFLMIALPMSGWVYVSSSELDVPTYFFGLWEWPHLPLTDLPERADIHHNSGDAHEIFGNVLLGLIILHTLAALKHHYFNRDDVLVRMTPYIAHQRPARFLVGFFVLVALFLTLLFTVVAGRFLAPEPEFNVGELSGVSATIPLRGGEWSDTVALDQNSGELAFYWYQPDVPKKGLFSEFKAHLNLNQVEVEKQLLDVDITMSQIATDSPDASTMLLDLEWFGTKLYPVATFRSNRIESEQGAWRVWGDLTIRDKRHPIDFLVQVTPTDKGRMNINGEFSLIRQEFDVGLGDWLSEEYVASEVLVQFNLNVKTEYLSAPSDLGLDEIE